MRMLLRPEFLNGPFGDPALYIWEMNAKGAMLFDCGDLSRFSIKQLLKIDWIFLSHCHIDHFFGFDLFLRVHVGVPKTVTIFGPLETSQRVGGKLQGYTWNLIYDQDLEFIVVELDPVRGKKFFTHFHAKDRFHPSSQREENWDSKTPVLDTSTYHVDTAMLDHRTPSLAYCVEEKLTVSVDAAKLKAHHWKPGPWINELKKWYLLKGSMTQVLEVLKEDGTKEKQDACTLAKEILQPKQRHKIAYATDGAASEKNRAALIPLVQDSDMFFCETCFLEQDRMQADETKHFTAKFIAELSAATHIKKLIPFHFSKRYVENSQQVWDEISQNFKGEILKLERNISSTDSE